MTEAQELRLGAALVAVLCAAMVLTLLVGAYRGATTLPTSPPTTESETP